ncbi:EAL domain-containing protein [Caballeronia sp. LZ065]|uniref:EAL and HDOD domain-containing protein n=1 Tax=Caballeronia sp. LZ065 TaxID=3038571 RepID=UPI00285DDB14|nr:EAL domain-containing protein [Caballeronia sp. LZ065]MDR5781268.1 EAL domain-containing protein [Caballeronia sp. LZ065]
MAKLDLTIKDCTKEGDLDVSPDVQVSEPDVLLARQPIMNQHGVRVGHELLFRPAPIVGFPVAEKGFLWTASVIQRALGTVGLEEVLDGVDGYFNCTEAFLESDLTEVLPAERTVLELSAAIAPSGELGRRCDTLRTKGFRIALSDLHLRKQDWSGVLRHVDIVKLDWRALGSDERRRLVDEFQRAGKIVIAEKVETRLSLDEARAAGCDHFQGYYFMHPEPVRGRQLAMPTAVLIRLLQLAMRDCRIDEIEKELRASPALTVQLLRLANAAQQPRVQRENITSIKHAMSLVGLRQLTRWCCLLLYGGATPAAMAHDPLIQMVLSRARFAERLAFDADPADGQFLQHAYLTALLSLVHVPHGVPATDFVGRLPISASMRAAILHGEGRLGALLCIAQSVESAESTPAERLAEIGYLPDRRPDWHTLKSMFYRTSA